MTSIRYSLSWDAASSIELIFDPELIQQATQNAANIIELDDNDYVLLSEEDVEKEINNQMRSEAAQ